MTDSNQILQYSNPEQAYVDALLLEAAGMPEAERAEQEALVAQLTGELATAETYRQQAQADIDRARQLAGRSREKEAEVPQTALDWSKIGWVSETGTETLNTEPIKTPSLEYDWLDITGKNRTTAKLVNNLQTQGVAENLLKALKEEKIPELFDDVRSGRGRQRPISSGGRPASQVKIGRCLDTSYPAYKVDVQGSNNRAIVLIISGGQRPTVALAALYDHDNQDAVYRHMFAKHK